MIRKLLQQLKDFLHKEDTQENIIKLLIFLRNVVAEYAVLILLNDAINAFIA